MGKVCRRVSRLFDVGILSIHSIYRHVPVFLYYLLLLNGKNNSPFISNLSQRQKIYVLFIVVLIVCFLSRLINVILILHKSGIFERNKRLCTHQIHILFPSIKTMDLYCWDFLHLTLDRNM